MGVGAGAARERPKTEGEELKGKHAGARRRSPGRRGWTGGTLDKEGVVVLVGRAQNNGGLCELLRSPPKGTVGSDFRFVNRKSFRQIGDGGKKKVSNFFLDLESFRRPKTPKDQSPTIV